MLNRHLKRSLAFISSIIVMAIAVVLILAWKALKPINQKNGFDRQFDIATINIENTKKNDGVVDLSGSTEHHLYFQTKNPSILLVTNLELQNSKYVGISVPKTDKMNTASIFVDSPNVAVLAGRIPMIIEGNINKDSMVSHKFPSSLFTRGVSISQSTYAFRGFDTVSKTSDQIFFKGNSVTGEIQKEKNISAKNNDGGISTDGLLRHDKKTGLLIYTFFYRNQFLCLDTNLNLLYSGRTIDTLSNPLLSAEANNRIMSATTPKRMVNATCAVSNGLLFNNSKLRADNEDGKNFNDNSVIDIYGIKQGDYKGSFYIPNYDNEKISRFKVMGDKVIAFYKSNIVVYSLGMKK